MKFKISCVVLLLLVSGYCDIRDALASFPAEMSNPSKNLDYRRDDARIAPEVRELVAIMKSFDDINQLIAFLKSDFVAAVKSYVNRGADPETYKDTLLNAIPSRFALLRQPIEKYLSNLDEEGFRKALTLYEFEEQPEDIGSEDVIIPEISREPPAELKLVPARPVMLPPSIEIPITWESGKRTRDQYDTYLDVSARGAPRVLIVGAGRNKELMEFVYPGEMFLVDIEEDNFPDRVVDIEAKAGFALEDFRAKPFDVIILEFLPKPVLESSQTWTNIFTILKPGGRVVMNHFIDFLRDSTSEQLSNPPYVPFTAEVEGKQHQVYYTPEGESKGGVGVPFTIYYDGSKVNLDSEVQRGLRFHFFENVIKPSFIKVGFINAKIVSQERPFMYKLTQLSNQNLLVEVYR